MRKLTLIGLACWLTLAVCGNSSPNAYAKGSWRVWPVQGAVLQDFKLGPTRYSPGHRGIDIAGRAEQSVRAAQNGRVYWVGEIDHVPMLSIQHADGTRSTYQPVIASIQAGDTVETGQHIGRLTAGHCADQPCLHFGVRSGQDYLDPLAWLAGKPSYQVRLLADDAKLTGAPVTLWDEPG